jgi:membrane-bound metal-dependent hydrolase YbcI (DUF457 family)
MPSPVGHTLAGCAVGLVLIPPGMPLAWEAWAVCLISANLADADFIPGVVVGNPRALHRGPSHTMLAACILAVTGASLWTWSPMPWLWRAGLIFLAYASHVGLDCLTPGRALMLGWPFSSRRYQVRRPWFLGVPLRWAGQHAAAMGGPWHLLRVIGREIVLMSPGVAIIALVR